MTPYIIQALGEPQTKIAVFFGFAGGAFLIGSLISGTIIHKLGVYKTSFFGIILIFLSGILLLCIYLFQGLSLWGFFGPSMLATLGCALTAGAGAGGALEPFGEYPGTASAMFGSLELGGSAIIGTMAAIFPLNTALPLAFTVLCTSIISVILLLLLHKSKK